MKSIKQKRNKKKILYKLFYESTTKRETEIPIVLYKCKASQECVDMWLKVEHVRVYRANVCY